MNDQNVDPNRPQEPFDLEQRLSAYYGPTLPEEPLSAASWQQLRLQLASHQQSRRGSRVRWLFLQNRSHIEASPSFQEALARITDQAHLRYRSWRLRCRLTSHRHDLVVQNFWLRRSTIHLLVPEDAVPTMEPAEREVLIATGIARSLCAHKPRYTLGHLLFALVVLLAVLTLTVCWMDHIPLLGFPIATALCASALWFLHTQARSIAFGADRLMVEWLGHQQVCRGLHAWADHSHAPGRRRWGEPSLLERIERVCRTHVEKGESQLTLAR